LESLIRSIQQKILKVLAKYSKTFALSGGTALDLYYLHHRFSKDLDFFSPNYNIKEINYLIEKIKQETKQKIKLEEELTSTGLAKVRFYAIPIEGYKEPLKLDFVEDVIFKKPTIRRFKGVPVYDVKNIYIQKIFAITGTHLVENHIGREITTGRIAARDIFDIYKLSQNVCPLHKFLLNLPKQQQRGMVQWYRSYSRQELKIDLLELDIYDKNFDSSKMIAYLDNEMKKFIEMIIQ